MNFIILYIIYILSLALIFQLHNKKILKSNFLNYKEKGYYSKYIENPRIKLRYTTNYVEHDKNGKTVIYNERSGFIYYGIILPIFILLCYLPLIYWYSDKLIVLCIVSSILILLYFTSITFLRFKLNNHKLMDESFPYLVSYTLFSLNYNKTNILLVPMFIFITITTNTLISKIILLILVIKMHIYIFIDKLDEYFNWNILESNKLKILVELEYFFTLMIITMSIFLIIKINPIYFIF